MRKVIHKEELVLDNVFILRHGNYNSLDSRLNGSGKEQIESIATRIKPLVQNRRTIILSSPAPRAKDSAIILCKIIDLDETTDLIINKILWSDNNHREDFKAAEELIMSYKDNYDVIIVVTHLEYTDRFPYYYGSHQLGIKFDQFLEIEKGQGVNIDCNKKTQSYI